MSGQEREIVQLFSSSEGPSRPGGIRSSRQRSVPGRAGEGIWEVLWGSLWVYHVPGVLSDIPPSSFPAAHAECWALSVTWRQLPVSQSQLDLFEHVTKHNLVGANEKTGRYWAQRLEASLNQVCDRGPPHSMLPCKVSVVLEYILRKDVLLLETGDLLVTLWGLLFHHLIFRL